MLLSVFTPTHDTSHLIEAYHSLKLQNVREWEWVLVPNGNATIPDEIRYDPRVRIVRGHEDLHNVGALKRRACDTATGDAFVELDHDDLLVPGDTLAKIRRKFQEGAGFVYSDAAVFRFRTEPGTQKREYKSFTYAAQHGWQDYGIRVYGRKFSATRCFPITPRSLSEIFYCPDHVRCWSRKAYYAAGGHNTELSVCDDHELMIKTYLAGEKFSHIGSCGYLYRMSDNNTVLKRNNLIQETSRSLRQRYLKELIVAWAGRESLDTLDMTDLRRHGWDPDKHLLQGFGVDRYGHIVADTELQRWSGSQVREFMNEAYEALVPGGYLTIIVPEVHSGMGYGDVEWKSHFSAVSLHPYTRRQMARNNGKVECRFQQINCVEVFPSDWHRDNGYKFLRFELVALKGQRQPGLQHI